ncbi:MAG: transglycosylase SLT domain-containing protein [Aquabacterium sp.]|nr:transglycosylase SLT domain-containing protein [Aquabacterium sp.]MBP9063630.1 transglycosylase SLT domain-containing protein [Aquabacterium sp.]
MDTLLKSQAGHPSAITKSIARRTTREDPNSGLQVDLGPAAVLTVEDEARAAANNREAKLAAGTPTDPLRPEATLNLDDSEATKDLWVRVRQGFKLPPLEHELVAQHERFYAARPDYVQRMTARANRYLFHVVEEIERRNMPAELALLPFIESAFNPQATSSARASGIWQFMPATGKDFDLTQNIFRDERRDVLASTRAALDYLQRLHRMFGDWHLALAAYNWGEGNVQRALKRNQSQGLPTDYLSINMPAETRNYVPKLHAVRNIIAQPDAYSLNLTPIENHPYFVSVPIQRDMDVALASRLAALPLDEFKALNPSQNKPVILAAGTPQVLLPYDNAHLFVHNLSKHKGALATWTAWLVPKTMRPADAARQLGMPESTLREVNRIPPKMLVKAGSTLLVHRSEQRGRDVSESLADNAMMALAPDVPPLRRMALKAGKRDTVRSVAKRYGISVEQVAAWNKVSKTARFKRGERIVVYVPSKSKAQSSRSVASAKKGRIVREAKVGSKPRLRGSKRVMTAEVKRSSKLRTGAKARNARVRVASAR